MNSFNAKSPDVLQFFEAIQAGLVVIDKDQQVVMANQAAGKIFDKSPSDLAGITGCCTLFRQEKTPCVICDLIKQTAPYQHHKLISLKNADGSDQFLKVQSSALGDHVLLTLQEISREQGPFRNIDLLRQNKILSGLVELGMYMQQGIEPTQVVNFFLDLFLPVLQTDAAAVLINDIRVGNLWLAAHWGMDDIVLNKLAKAYLDRDIQNFRSDILPPEFFPWPKTTQVVLTGADGRRVGLIVLRGDYNTHSEMIQLFAEQMGAYIHNQLLMRQLEEKAYTDPLTGLFNRAYIDKALAEEYGKFKKYDIHYAVVVGDVNRLKEVNDAYGHETGDRLLQMVGTILKNEARATDIVARAGGDEFVILLTNSTHKSAQLFAKRLSEVAFRGIALDVGEDEKFPVSISLGAAGTDAVPPDKLINEADKLMYEAKKAYYANHPFYRSRPLWANV